MADHQKITPKLKKDFLRLLSETGNVTKCCTALNISRVRMYIARNRSKKFAEQWVEARMVAVARLEDEAWRRAFDGIEKKVWYQGKEVGTERVYSDALMMQRLNAERPDKYHYRQSVEHSGNIVTEVHVNFVKSEVEKDDTGS